MSDGFTPALWLGWGSGVFTALAVWHEIGPFTGLFVALAVGPFALLLAESLEIEIIDQPADGGDA